MYAEDVKISTWVQVEDWSTLPKMDSLTNVVHVEEEDMENFLHDIYREIAEKCKIPYETAAELMEEENKDFYAMKKALFEKCSQIRPFNEELLALKELLWIPVEVLTCDSIQMSKVEKVIEAFSALTDDEKNEVIERLGLLQLANNR